MEVDLDRAQPVKILCVDDDPSIRETLSAALAEDGYAVACARDGQEAVREFQAGGVDLVVLDLGLPDKDGLAVCRELKALAGSFLPVLFLTARSDVETMTWLLDQGGDDFCAKPFLFEELLSRIRVLLRVRERERRLERRTEVLERTSLLDPLTGLGNRRAFDEALKREWSRSSRSGEPLALLVADVDRFKAVNDRFGHLAGDDVLRAVASAILGAVREGDQAFRFGGEELAVLVPRSSREAAQAVADRVRRQVAGLTLPTGPVTVSVGVGLGPGPGADTVEQLFEAVDQALYAAKGAGRNRVVAAWPREVARPRSPASMDATRPILLTAPDPPIRLLGA